MSAFFSYLCIYLFLYRRHSSSKTQHPVGCPSCWQWKLLSTESAVTSHVLLNPCSAVLTFLESSGLLAFSAGNVLSPGLREAEFSSMNSAVLGTMLPGFFVASMTHMCPISVCFLLVGILPQHSSSWHMPPQTYLLREWKRGLNVLSTFILPTLLLEGGGFRWSVGVKLISRGIL